MSEGILLNQLQEKFPHVHQLIDDMKMYYTEKLWHQLTDALLDLVRDEKVLHDGPALISIYDQFVKNFEQHIDPIKFVRFISRVSNHKGQLDDRIHFLDQIIDKSLSDEQAKSVLRLKRAEFLLEKQQFEEVDKLIQEVLKDVTTQANIDTLVHSTLFKVGYIYNQLKKNYDNLYQFGLQYLAYTSEIDISQKEKFELSVEMAQAILISPLIYNFSELLQQPVVQSLKNTEKQWIYDLLECYNKANVTECQQLLQQLGPQIQQQPLLVENQQILVEKIRIMAFLDLVFNQPKNQRVITFNQIAQISQVPVDEVELLLMRAQSKKLIKGKIDQVRSVIEVDWIIPRVLDKQRIQIMSDKLEGWHKSLMGVFNLLDQFNQLQ